ncbi:MAG: alpha-2-macroglobulin family protein [Alphaproteobacteria bacterium]|nr:alpha-2-macroglobulin family protein [Alphaproteobacteria bacterium]
MGRNLRVVIFLVILVAAGAVGFFASQHVDTIKRLAATPAQKEEAAAAKPSNPGEAAKSGEQASGSGMPAPATFAFERLEIHTGQTAPEACLVFSRRLDETGATQYENYLTIEPDVRPGLRVAGNLLCLTGLSFGEIYTVTLREGLPSAGEERLAWAETVPVELRDRPPAVAFGSGFILPRESTEGVPIRTVNVAALHIRVYRVGDRLLSQLRASIVDDKLLYPYESDDIAYEKGALVWEGEMDTPGEPNADTVTLFPLDKALPARVPGIYLVLAEDTREASSKDEDSYDYDGTAAQWIVESDIGLTSFMGEDGLTMHLRSLASARPMKDVRLELVAHNNEILGEARTDASGTAKFPVGLTRGAGGMEPAVVMAYGPGGDFAYLDLRRPAFDLSDRGVGGRDAPAAIDAFLYTERGVYRPGETVELVTLLRDSAAKALGEVPLTLSVRRPDGIEFRRLTITQETLGAAASQIALTRSAPLGRWSVLAYVDTSGEPVGRVAFDVQDFVPERLKVALETQAERLEPLGQVSLTATTRFLYGAPAAGLEGEAELRLTVADDPFPNEKDFVFGRTEELFSDKLMPLTVGTSNAQGVSEIAGALEDFGETTKPLEARINVAMFEPGGRATREQLSLPVVTTPLMIGIRPRFEGGSVPQNGQARFEIIALDPAGRRIAAQDLSWQLIREVTQYQWYELNGRWMYEVVHRDRPVAAGRLSVDADSSADIAGTVAWGSYRVEIVDPRSGAATSLRFYAGWGSEDADRPDRVVVTSEKKTYRAGETALVEILAPTPGPALVVVASDRIHQTQMIDVPEGGARALVDVKPEWGAGAYVLVTSFRPMSGGPARAPVRAVGLTWIALDQSTRTLSVAVDAPEIAPPESDIDIGVKVSGLLPGEQAVLTLAAVDEGILQLTNYKSPSPTDYYFGKRRLALEMRDEYGRLIRDAEGEPGAIRSGGDGMGGSGVTSIPQRTVALFSGLVTLDGDGRANVPVHVPDYVGELRLMAVVAAATKLGQADKPMTVRTGVVGDLTLPRFLAPGDRGQVTLNIHNVEGPGGTYIASLAAHGAVSIGETVRLEIPLEPGARREIAFPLDGLAVGKGGVELLVEGPAGVRLERSWEIEVRAAQLPEITREAAVLPPSERFALKQSLLDPYLSGTTQVSVALGSAPGYDIAGLLAELDRYPFGCIEQTVSRAFPLLYFNELATRIGFAGDKGADERLQTSVDRVLDMQSPDGGFAMWGPWDTQADEWLSLYALDFLLEARAKGNLVVPEDALRRALRFAQNIADQSWRDAHNRAYAHYLLATSGHARPGDLRYIFDSGTDGMADALSMAFLSGALAEIGDVARASKGFEKAVAMLAPDAAASYEAKPKYYGSRRRDIAAVTALAARAGQGAAVAPLLELAMATGDRYTTTQEEAWMLLAAHALGEAQGQPQVRAEGIEQKTEGDPLIFTAREQDLARGVAIANNGERDLYRVLTVVGVPKDERPAADSGANLTKTFYTLDGTKAALDRVKPDSRLVVLVSGRMNDDAYREMSLIDLLPAGFEVEGVVQSDAQGRSAYAFLPPLTRTRMAQGRDDRFLAAFDIGKAWKPKDEPPTKPAFAVAYVVRAIMPGKFALPAAKTEDMYMPSVFARTAMGSVTILDRP